MVLPFIPLVLVGLGTSTGVGGLVTGVMGGMKLKEAQSLAVAAQKRYDASTSRTQKHVDRVNERTQAYGSEQDQARQLVVKRMGAFIERHRRQVKESAAQLLDGVSAEQKDIEAFAGALTADIGWIKGAGMAAAAGVGAAAGIPSSPLADIGDLSQVRKALDHPDHVREL